MRQLHTIILLLLSAAALADAQTVAADSVLTSIEASYNAGQYLAAEVDARRTLEQNMLSDSVKIQLEKWIAFSLIAQGRSAAARERFVVILKRDGTFELDPVLTSPKILAVFNEARTIHAAWKRTVVSDSLRTLNGMSAASGTPVTFRTIVFPGWEQLHQGREQAGYLYLGAGVLTLTSGIAFEFLRADARERYRSSVSRQDIASAYDTYNGYRKAEIYSFAAFGLVYIMSELDVFYHAGLTVSPMVSGTKGLGVTLSLRH